MEMETEAAQVLEKFTQNEFVDALRRNVLFQELTKEQLVKVFSYAHEQHFDPGSFIIHQGELGAELFIIQTGAVEILKSGRTGGSMHQLAVLHAGDSFGELALIDSGVRSASVRALQPTTVLVLTGIALDSLLHESDIIALIYKGLCFQMSGRLRFVNEIATAALEQETNKNRLQNVLAAAVLGIAACIAVYTYYLGTQSCLSNVENAVRQPVAAQTPAMPSNQQGALPTVPQGL